MANHPLLAAIQRRMTLPLRWLLLRWLLRAMAALAAAPPAAAAPRDGSRVPATQLRIVGGLGNLNQHTRRGWSFRRNCLPALAAGNVQADIAPFDRAV